MKIKHYYHVFADGHWHTPFTEHIEALKVSGLIDNLDELNFGIVGCDDNRKEVISALPPGSNICIEACTGYEQVTMGAFDLSEPAYILYAHTKGASNPNSLRKIWRNSMTNGCVYGWEFCTDLLDQGYDAVGCYWQHSPKLHFSGTFWWATTDYLSTLTPILHQTRFDAEMWIGQTNKGGKIGDLCPGFISASNVLSRQPGNPKPDPFLGQATFTPRSKIAGYVKGRQYTATRTPFIENCIARGHFELVGYNLESVRTYYIKR